MYSLQIYLNIEDYIKSIYVLCHRNNVKYDVFYAKVLQCPPLHSVDAGCLAVEQIGCDRQSLLSGSLLVYIMADHSLGGALLDTKAWD